MDGVRTEAVYMRTIYAIEACCCLQRPSCIDVVDESSW